MNLKKYFQLDYKRLYITKIIYVLLSPYFLAFAVSTPIIYLLPDIFQKYVVEKTWSGPADKNNSFEEYIDLDLDGYSERVIAFPSVIGLPSVKVLHNDGTLIDQWNLSGKYPNHGNYFYCADLNSDSLLEIYVFTISSDTLYLNAFEPHAGTKFIFRNKFISLIGKYDNHIDVSIKLPIIADLDRDGLNELVFTIHAGFSKQPRGIFAYNAKLDTVFRTPVMAAFINNVLITDLNGDHRPEIYSSSQTLGNIPDSLEIPYNDYSSWLMGFNEKLEFLFPPLEYKAYPSYIKIQEIKTGSKNRIVALFKNKSKTELSTMIALVNESGDIIRKKLIQDYVLLDKGYPDLLVSEDSRKPLIMLISDDNQVVLLDTLLQTLTEIPNLPVSNLLLKSDINRDGRNELIFRTNDYNLIITQSTLDDPVFIKTERDPFSNIPFCVSVKLNGNNAPELFVKADNKASLYTYKFNKLYYLKYPIWLGIYLIILAIILIIRRIQQVQLQQKMEIENRMNALQLKTIKSQMDPHFMFNVLNSISTNILTEQKEQAYRYMVKFSSLLRTLFTKSDELVVSLKDELDFVENYLELEKFRFKDKLNYKFEIDPGLDQSIQLPRMLIQLFVENAIKHGLRHKEGEGHILIRAEKKNGQLIIIIEDNGIGRKAARQFKEGNGKGTKDH